MKNKFTYLVLTFAAGVIIGAAIVWMLCICCNQKNGCHMGCGPNHCTWTSDTTGIHRINVSTANAYFNAYLNNPMSVDTLKAFSINAAQFRAMNYIAQCDSNVHGFRIYMGMDSLVAVRMVVGTGSPDITELIYVTDDLGSGPCPHICDDSSPIIEE